MVDPGSHAKDAEAAKEKETPDDTYFRLHKGLPRRRAPNAFGVPAAVQRRSAAAFAFFASFAPFA